jgi:hypothetical protein
MHRHGNMAIYLSQVTVCPQCGWSPAFNPYWDPRGKQRVTCRHCVGGRLRPLTPAEEAVVLLDGIMALRDMAPGWAREDA